MSSVTSPDDTQVALPKDVERRLSFWYGLWHRSSAYHYFFGVISVAASVISTSTDGTAAKVCSIVAAIATSLIGFMHPERRYLKFVRAWRVLDVAAMRYRHGLIDKTALIDAVEKGEACIAELEDKYNGAADADAEAGRKDAGAGAVEAAPPAPAMPVDPVPTAMAEPAVEPAPTPAAETQPSTDPSTQPAPQAANTRPPA